MITPLDVANFAIAYSAYHRCLEHRQDGGIAVWGQDLIEQATLLGLDRHQLLSLSGVAHCVEGANRRLAAQKAAEEAEATRQNSVRAQLRLITGGAA